MSEHREPIPSMIYNAAVGGHVTNSQQIIDENENKEQSQINAEVKQVLGQGGSVDLRIAAAVNSEKTRAQTEEENIRQLYSSLSQSQPIPVTSLPATGEAGKIYRLAGATSYADYMYAEGALTTPIKMAEYDNAIDDEPTSDSGNLVKSSGVAKLFTAKCSIGMMNNGGGKCLSDLTVSSSTVTLTFNGNVTILGTVDTNYPFVNITVSGSFTIGNMKMLVADVVNDTFDVIDFTMSALYSGNTNPHIIVIAYNLWGKVISPIASLQNELYQWQYLNSDINNTLNTAKELIDVKADIKDVINSEYTGINVCTTPALIGEDGYNNRQPTKIAGTDFNTLYAEEQISVSETPTTYNLKQSISKCSSVKVLFKATFNNNIGVSIYFRKNGAWFHNDSVVTKYFIADTTSPQTKYYWVERKYIDGADEAIIIFGSGEVSALPSGTTFRIGWSRIILENSVTAVVPKVNEIVVDINGGGDFTSVREAVSSISDASEYNRYHILVRNGNYNEFDIMTKDYVDIEGESRDGVVLYADGTSTSNSPSDFCPTVYHWTSDDYSSTPINTIPKALKHLFWMVSNSHIKNMTLKCRNCKYVIHQDFGNAEYKSFVENCVIIREEDFTSNVSDYDKSLQNLIGVGASGGCYQNYINCIFILATVNVPSNYHYANLSAFLWHNLDRENKPCGATLKDCNVFGCDIADIYDLGSEQNDIINILNVVADNPKWGINYKVNTEIYGSSPVPYCVRLNIHGNNPNYVLLSKDRLDDVSVIYNAFTNTIVQVNTDVLIGQPIAISDTQWGGSSIASSKPFGVALQNKNNGEMCMLDKGNRFNGLAVSGTYSYGDSIYIKNDKFTNEQNGESIGISIEDITLSNDGLLQIQRNY